MEFFTAKKTFQELKSSRLLLITCNLLLIILLGTSFIVNLNKDTVVISNLNESCNYSELTSDTMNEATHKRLGLYLSGMLGNITPANADYVKKAILPFASADIYQKVATQIAIEAGDLQEESVSLSFVPETAFVEDGITFISGKGQMTGLSSKVEKFVRTYEFEFDVNNYTPTFKYLNVYDDVPHDRIWKDKQEAKEDIKRKKRG